LRVIARMNIGGPALQVVALTEGLTEPEFTTRLLIGSVGSDEADYLQLRAPHISAVTVPGLGRTPNPLGDVSALSTLVGEIRRFRPHIVHTHTAKAGLLGRVAARMGRVPYVVHTFHGHLLHGYFPSATTRAIIRTERVLARSTSRLVAVGAKVRDELLAVGIGTPEQYVVIPPGVTLPPLRPTEEARELLGLPAGRPVVGFVARLTEVKRPDRFVEVALEVSRRLPGTVFAVAGEGGLLAAMREHARPLGDSIHFLGWRPDVETVYAACDVLLLTSDNEGMPVSLIEGAVSGTPAVTTDVGSAREVVVDGVTGFVTPPTVVALAGAVERLLTDGALREGMRHAAKAFGLEHFTTARLVSDTAAMYRELASHLVES
jgi:glycosyltransferase involved in cell wall biosynthesis